MALVQKFHACNHRGPRVRLYLLVRTRQTTTLRARRPPSNGILGLRNAPDMSRRFWRAVGSSIAIATTGLAATIALGLLACLLHNWAPAARVGGVSREWIGPVDGNGRGWWVVVRSHIGSEIVNSMGLESDSHREEILQRVGASMPPWWSISREWGTPPSIEFAPRDDVGLPWIQDAGFGWPRPCLAYRVSYWRATPDVLNGGFERRPEVMYGAFHRSRLGDSFHHAGWWPTRVLWTNLLVNWAVMNVIVATPVVLWQIFILAIAWRRRSRGLCTECGYPGVQASKCPECGSNSGETSSRLP